MILTHLPTHLPQGIGGGLRVTATGDLTPKRAGAQHKVIPASEPDYLSTVESDRLIEIPLELTRFVITVVILVFLVVSGVCLGTRQ